MFLVVDGICRGVGRGQRIKNRPQSKPGVGISEQQKDDDIDSTTTTTNVNASAFEDEDVNVDDENFAMKKALGIHLVLKKILSYLSIPKLLQVRLVSPVDWFDVATDILIRRRCLRIDFAYSSKIDCFTTCSSSIHDESSSSSKKEEFPELYDTLHKLTNCIRMSIKFPCVRFGLFGELNKREVKEFLDVYGSQVKELDLVLAFPLINPQLKPPFDLANILLTQAPNLDGLHINSVKNKPENANPSLFNSSTSSPVKLPKLKTIIINEGVDRDLEIIQDIITASVANRGFKCHFDFPSQFSIEHVDLFIQMNKLDSVRHLNVSHPFEPPGSENDNSDSDSEDENHVAENAENPAPENENPVDEVENPIMELYRRFANTHYKLYSVYLDHTIVEGDFEDILSKIFYYSHKSLGLIETAPHLEDMTDIRLPMLNSQRPYRWYDFNFNEKELSEGEKLICGDDKYDLLLKKILSHLNTSQLLDCRLVKRNWNKLACKILIERKSIHLHFVFSPQANRFILSRNQKENVELPLDFFVEDLHTLSNFTKWPFRYSYNHDRGMWFPCYKISVMTALSIMERELHYLPWNVDYNHGLSELELIFDFGPHTHSAEWNFISNLLQRARHLKVLTLTNINNYKSPRSCAVLTLDKFKIDLADDCLSIQMLQMDKLDCRVAHPTNFTIESYQSLLEEIGAGSVSMIFSHLEFRPTGKNIQVCQKIAESFSQLCSINIDLSAIYEEGESDIWRKVSSILSQILSRSKETLMKINGIDQLGFLPGLKLPRFSLIKGEKGLVLRNLKYSKVHQVFGIPDFTVSLLPRGCKFSTCFPFLTSLIINYFPDGAEIDQHHSHLDIVPNIKRLSIGQKSSPVTPAIFQKISRMFPELEFLFVTVNVEDFYRMSRNIWTKFPKLNELCILFIIRAELEKQEYFPGLDAAFTGYPESFCNIRKGFPPRHSWKKYPSLNNLKELKSLHIFFEDFSRPEDPWDYLTRICNRGTFSEFPLGNISVEAKTCDSRNIQKIQHALRWLSYRTHVKVDTIRPIFSKIRELTK